MRGIELPTTRFLQNRPQLILLNYVRQSFVVLRIRYRYLIGTVFSERKATSMRQRKVGARLLPLLPDRTLQLNDVPFLKL